MTESLKPYAKYKSSGSSWIGYVPDSWRVQNLRALIKSRAARNRADLPLLSVARERGVFVRSLEGADANHNVIPEDLSNYKVARQGDLVINKMKAWQGSMGIAPCDGIVSPAYFVYEFGISNRDYGERLLRSWPYVAHFAHASDGVRIGQWDLTIRGMREIPVVIPPDEEQISIAAFLDGMDRKIMRFLKDKQKMIQLLEEQRISIVDRAVTVGIDPSVNLGPTGIEWLKCAPENWRVIRAKNIFECVDVRSKSGQEELLTVSSERGIVPRNSTTVMMFKAETYVGHKLCWPGDLVINSLWAWSRGLGVSKYHGIVSTAYGVYRLRAGAAVDERFVHELLRSRAFQWELQVRSKGIWKSRLQLTDDSFLSSPLVIPPLDEQLAIIDFINKETALLENALDQARSELSLIRDFRKRLIADVVTGKLDVREAARMLDPIVSNEPTLDHFELLTESELEEEESLDEDDMEEAQQ